MKTTETLFYEISKVLNADEGVGKLISVAARPGMGKTTLCLRITADIVKLGKTKVLFFSLEESKNKLIDILSDKWNLESENLAQILIDETPALSVDYIEKKISEIPDLSVVFIDYIELIKDFTAGSQNEILNQLKEICKSKNVSIIYTCNLDRRLEKRINKRPILSDLDECTQKNADTIFALYREAYYMGDDSAAELRTLKNTYGELISIPLIFDRNRLSFEYDDRNF